MAACCLAGVGEGCSAAASNTPLQAALAPLRRASFAILSPSGARVGLLRSGDARGKRPTPTPPLKGRGLWVPLIARGYSPQPQPLRGFAPLRLCVRNFLVVASPNGQCVAGFPGFSVNSGVFAPVTAIHRDNAAERAERCGCDGLNPRPSPAPPRPRSPAVSPTAGLRFMDGN